MQALHQEALLQLFLERPRWAVELVDRLLQQPLPLFTAIRVEPIVIVLRQRSHRIYTVVLSLAGKPVFGMVLAVQLAFDDEEAIGLWPLYACHVRATLHCPTAVLVVAPHEAVARSAAAKIDLGDGNFFRPWVIGPNVIPAITLWEEAKLQPELAILSALAHGRDADTDKAVLIALNAIAASMDLDTDRAIVYVDLVYDALSEAARARASRPENFSR